MFSNELYQMISQYSLVHDLTKNVEQLNDNQRHT
jgi:hypothetical protein